MTIDLHKMYDNGIDNLFMGGEILDDCFYREKDVLEDDYSEPALMGKLNIVNDRVNNGYHYLELENGGNLVLTEDEYQAGIC